MKGAKERTHKIDIAKAILIYLVVVGHYFTGDVHTYIFWFHMPAFIMISGLFIRDNVSLKNELIKKTRRLLVPYFFFSILLGTVGTDTSFWMQIVGTLVGADYNATPCTYPYYFITQLFVAFLLFIVIQTAARRNNKGSGFIIGVVAGLYTLMQIAVHLFPIEIWGRVPWNADMAFVSVAFLCVGKYTKTILTSIRGGYVAVAVALLLIVLQVAGCFDYSYDFRYHKWHWGQDIIIPYVFLMAILVISERLDNVGGLNRILRYVGNASLVIMFLHPFFMKVNKHFFQPSDIGLWIMALFVVSECTVCYWLFLRSKYTRWIVGERWFAPDVP